MRICRLNSPLLLRALRTFGVIATLYAAIFISTTHTALAQDDTTEAIRKCKERGGTVIATNDQYKWRCNEPKDRDTDSLKDKDGKCIHGYIIRSGGSTALGGSCGKPGDPGFISNQEMCKNMGGEFQPPNSCKVESRDEGYKPNADEKPVCVISNLGWAICPLLRFSGKLADKAFEYTEALLRYESLANDSTYKSIEKVWSTIRNIANAAFVIVLLIIVLSHTSGFGLQNYGIKRLLPRLIIITIITNISLPLAAMAIDLSNLAGSGIARLTASTLVQKGLQANTFTEVAQNVLAGSVFVVGGGLAGAVTGGLVVKGVLYGLVAILIPVVILGLLTFAFITVILLARQAILPVLIIMTPLALVAYLLPNTATFFQKWRQYLISMLLLYPLIGLLFGLSRLAAYLLISVNEEETLLQIAGLGVQILPLAALPIILRSIGGMNGVARVASGLGNTTNNFLERGAMARVQPHLTKAQAAAQAKANKYFLHAKGDGLLTRLGKGAGARIVAGSTLGRSQRKRRLKQSEAALKYSQGRYNITSLMQKDIPRNDHVRQVLRGQALRDFIEQNEELVEAQSSLYQSMSPQELDSVRQSPEFQRGSPIQKVAMLHEMARRGNMKGADGALAYAQKLVNENAQPGAYSDMIGGGVRTMLEENFAGVMPSEALMRISQQPADSENPDAPVQIEDEMRQALRNGEISAAAIGKLSHESLSTLKDIADDEGMAVLKDRAERALIDESIAKDADTIQLADIAGIDTNAEYNRYYEWLDAHTDPDDDAAYQQILERNKLRKEEQAAKEAAKRAAKEAAEKATGAPADTPTAPSSHLRKPAPDRTKRPTIGR